MAIIPECEALVHRRVFPFLPCLMAAVIIMSSLALTADADNGDSSNGDIKLKVVVSNTDIAPIVNAIGGRHIELKELLPAGSDPHGYLITPEGIKALEDADIIVLINSKFLHYEENIQTNNPGKTYIDFKDYESNGLKLKDFPNYPANQHGFWLGFDNAIAIARTVAETLESSTLSKYSGEFRYNLDRFESAISDLKNTIKDTITDSELEGGKFVAAIPGVNYIIDNMGITVGSVLLAEGSGFVSGGELADIESKLSDGSYAGIVCPDSMRDAKAGEISEQLAKDTGSKVYYVKFLEMDLESDYIATGYHNAMVFTSGLNVLESTSDDARINYFIIALAVLVIVALIEAFIIYRFKVQSEDFGKSDGPVLFNHKKGSKTLPEKGQK
jgi:ABC-type Zn uptake system ZnuABC Zn-binding protein ZnuA